jgi:hypothetical protein
MTSGGKAQAVPAPGPEVAPARSPIEPVRASRPRRSPLVALGAALAVVAGIGAVAFMAFSPQGTTAQGAQATAAGDPGQGLPEGIPDAPLAGSSGNSTTGLPLPAPTLPSLPGP